ncbi:hypothetical protein N7481_006255 [Penicillium waksmanii]|uniref:uncharacterized protein n=1 Tax=Penicillium waksmanii TaxID=69791 RepID=UPI00254825EE|nr:uncharacterized protein N7481_006255 [Penicillium waksmanii]KAJ5984156.1 hypothetical protein N7481_006255 [Penicillium waksmanii]
MTNPRDKKLRKRRSVFGLWIPAKVVPFSNRFDTSPTDSAVSDSPASDSIIRPRRSRDRLKVRLTRSGSKILFLFGLGGSSNGIKTSVGFGSCGDISSPEGDQTPSSEVAERGSPISLTSDGSPESESPVVARSIDVHPPATTALDNPAEIPADRHISTAETDVRTGECETQRHLANEDSGCFFIGSEPASHPNSTLVDRFSQRFSHTFGHPTVIRRAHLRSRPSIPFQEYSTTSTPDKLGDGADDSSDPSTAPSSNESPLVGVATPQTPVTSEEKSTSSEKYNATSGRRYSLDCASDINTTAGSRSPTLAPSILTIESTSAAKLYLELYFNSIFQNVDPRAQAETRKNWLLQENGYLRQCRNLKTKMRSTRVEGKTSIAGYETIKILGRGSFGVVRLVREKDDIKSDGEAERTSRPERALSNPRPRSIGALRSAADGAKNGRRKVMTGEKKEVYAMKVIRKREMISNSQEGHIRAERDFLVASERSQWVVPLISSFQDNANLYLVMDYMVGGDFLGLLIRKDILREEWTRFYVAEMILCIEEAHRLCWIHRDIKPDNFLISASGHLKISDFGLAFNGHWSHDQVYYHNQRYSLLGRLGVTIKGDKKDQSQMTENVENSPDPRLHGLEDPSRYSPPSTDLLEWRNSKERRRFAKSVVGTSQYMAPEVIRGEMYDGRCDWWSLGVIIYECFYGFTPFACENRHDTKVKILQHSRSLKFPREKPTDKIVSLDGIDLISQILQEREFRLCSPRYHVNDILIGRPVTSNFLYSMDPRYRHINSYYVFPNDAVEIKAHPFFRGIQWNQLHLTQPPMIPRVKSWEDTRYFEDWKSSGNAEESVGDSDNQESEEKSEDKPNDSLIEASSSHQIHVLSDQPAPDVDATTPANVDSQKAPATKKKRERKRARDKILRDRRAGKTALEIRKRSVFLGYTYRRPIGPELALSPDRGRQRIGRRELMDLYAY